MAETGYDVDETQLTIYLVFTILSIAVSMLLYVYVMECSELGKHSREDYNRMVYNFIVER